MRSLPNMQCAEHNSSEAKISHIMYRGLLIPILMIRKDTINMEINATYAYTMQRNRYDGTTHFCVVPQGPQDLPLTPGSNLLVCIGRIPPYLSGMPIILLGRMDDSTFLFEAVRLDCQSRTGIEALLECISLHYLEHKLTPHQIEKILDACNNDIFSFCIDDECLPILCEICKRTKHHERMVHQLIKILRNLAEQQEFYSVLQHYNIPYAQIDAMHRKSISLDALRKNPYLLLSQFDVPIAVADAFARSACGMTDYARPRCLGYVHAALRFLLSSGHTCCTLTLLIETINDRYARFLGSTHFGPALVNACILDMPDICRYHTIDGITYIYPNATWHAESSAVHHIHRLQNAHKNYNTTISATDTAAEIGIDYNSGQLDAFGLLRTSGIKILTGPPGSGKTATINGLIRNFEANGNGIVHLAATTGRAARVMQNATGRNAETAHAMLRMTTINGVIHSRDLNDPVDADLIVVDEISMMGIQLFSALLGAVRNGAIVLLVGVEHQLQSVECGNVLHDLIESGKIEVCRLTEILRQSGTICTNAAKVNTGDMDLDLDNTFSINTVSEHNIQQFLADDYNPLTSQIITPLRNGPLGTNALNRMVQAHINGNSPVVACYGDKMFRLGDKVIMTRNNYDRGYVNGDIGRIKLRCDNGDLLIEFANGALCITEGDVCNMDLAYAITVHKSQGSEFSRVHIILPKSCCNMMTRRLLYTAITRAQKQVFIYDQDAALQDAIADSAETSRTTMLAHQLIARWERW